MYDMYLADDFADYPIWACSTIFPAWFEWGDSWTVWQYNNRGKLEGYSGGEASIDLNVVAGGRAGLEQLVVGA